jgi:hypothetical protein
MKRNSLILYGILVLLAIAAFLVLRQPGEQSASTSLGEPLVTYDSSAVDKLEITSSSGAVTLERQGGKWMMTSPVRYPADEVSVTNAVGKGRDMKITNLASTNPAKQSTFAVDSSATLVKVYANNNIVAAFRAGKQGSTWTESYARKEGSNEVYTVEGMLGATFVKQPNDWRDKTIFKTDQSKLGQIKLQFPGSGKASDTTFTLSKKDSITWVVDGDSTINSNVTSFVSALANLQADEFVDSAITVMPKLTLAIETHGTQLRFYKRADGKYYVQSSASPQWFTVQEWKANQLLKRKRDFVPAPAAKK